MSTVQPDFFINSFLLKHPLRQPQISNSSEKEETHKTQHTNRSNLSETQESTVFLDTFQDTCDTKESHWLVHIPITSPDPNNQDFSRMNFTYQAAVNIDVGMPMARSMMPE